MAYGKLEKSARKHYVAGRYDQVVFDDTKSLKLKPDYDKTQQLIQDSFRATVNKHKRTINNLESFNQKFKKERNV